MERDEILKALSIKDGRLVMSRCKGAILDAVMSHTHLLDVSYTLKDRVEYIRGNLTDAPVCKNCKNPVHWDSSASEFSSYCSNRCHKNSGSFLKSIQGADRSRYPSVLLNLTADELLKALTRADGVITTAVGNGMYDADIMNLTSSFHPGYTLYDRVKCLENNASPPVCKNCGKIVHWENGVMLQYCGSLCQARDPSLIASRVANRDYDSIQSKMKDTCLEKYGVEYSSQAEEIKQKVRASHKNGLGFQNSETRAKARATMMERYGTYSHMPVKISKPHRMLVDWLDSIGINYKSNDRSAIDRELDLFFPDHNFAVEINGVYWHSEKHQKDRYIHEKKYQSCISKGIKLIQFWDFEILNRFEFVKSMISSNLKLNRRIFARNCSVIELDAPTTNKWYEKTHIQGGLLKRSHALVHDGEVVAVMVISNGILMRFSSALNITVVGGMSKLIKSFNQPEIITYSDNRYSDAGAYIAAGFKLLRQEKEPKYYYTFDFKSLIPRWNMTRARMQKLQGFDFDECKTEYENAINNGFTRVWGCNGQTWILKP